MAQNNQRLFELTTLVESIVAQVLNKSFGEQMATWAANNPRTSLYKSLENGDRGYSDVGQTLGGMGRITDFMYGIDQMKLGELQNTKGEALKIDKLKNEMGALKSLGGLIGIASAYQSGDALGGAMSGFAAFGPWGAAAGLLAGLLSKGVDRWQRPKFKDSKDAFDKLFTMDRGERNDYYMPDSFYFRGGGNSHGSVVVKIGNHQLDDHIRESLTNNYGSQLQRGLVFY